MNSLVNSFVNVFGQNKMSLNNKLKNKLKNRVKTCHLFLIGVGLVLSQALWASDSSNPAPGDKCEAAFTPDPKDQSPHTEIMIHSTTFAPEVERYQQALDIVRDVSKRLGLLRGIDRHVLEIMSPRAVASLAVTNRYPVGSYMDGAVIVQQAAGAGGVLEFVLSGKGTQHSYYLSTLGLTEFLSIVIHVYGHNFFHVHSHYPHKTAVDRVGASIDLDQLMADMSKIAHPNEVEDWYFRLLSVQYAQDYWSGSYETPDSLKPRPLEAFRQWADGSTLSSERQAQRTESLLQAFVAELPPSTPPWKVEMAKRIEAMNRFIPGAVNTKVVNEGFATLCQYIVFEHLPEDLRRFPDAAVLGNMMSGVTYPKKDNPYFLGVEIWKAIRAEFNARKDILPLSPFERDHAFIKYAQSLISDPNFGNNMPFIQKMLPDPWIQRLNLAFVRKFSEDEVDELQSRGLVPPQKNYGDTLYQVVTHNPDRIRMSFMQDWNWHRIYPFLTWKNLHEQADDVARFEVGGRIGRITPINRQTLGPALLMWSQILQKRVELEATLLLEVNRENGQWGFGYPEIPQKVIGYRLVRAKVSLDPKGQLSVRPMELIEIEPLSFEYHLGGVKKMPPVLKFTPLDPKDAITLQIQKEQEGKIGAYLAAFQADYFLDREQKDEMTAVRFGSQNDPRGTFQQGIVRKAITAMTAPLVSDLSVGDIPPGVLRAISAYDQKVAQRFLSAFYRALKGRPLSPQAGGVRVKVLPSAPTIQFDRRAQIKIKQMLSRLPFHPDNPYTEDDGLIFSSSQPLADGTYYWKEKKQGNSEQPGDGDEEGDGEGDGDGDADAEGSDEEGDGDSSGQKQPNKGTGGGKDPTYIDVPLDLYAQLMAEEIELPHLRPLKGLSESMKKVPRGAQVGDVRPLAVKKTARKLISLGLGAIANLEEDGQDVSDLDPLEVGIQLAGKPDLYTPGVRKIPNPDLSAHVTIVADNSGSMMMELPKLRNMIFNLRMLLRKKYKNIVFTYIAFDGEAHVFEDHEEDKFFKVHLGGGTDYRIGTEQAIEEQKKFPEAEYDRYVLVFGDLYEAHSPELAEATEKIKGQSRFFGVIKMGMFGRNTGPLEDYYRNLEMNDPFAGFVDVPDGPDFDLVGTFKKLFKNEKKAP